MDATLDANIDPALAYADSGNDEVRYHAQRAHRVDSWLVGTDACNAKWRIGGGGIAPSDKIADRACPEEKGAGGGDARAEEASTEEAREDAEGGQ